MRLALPMYAALLSLSSVTSASARELVVCNYVGSPMAHTKPHEVAPGTMLKCKDKVPKDISNSLAGLYGEGYRLISVVPFETQYEGKQTLVLQYYLEK